MIRKNGFRLLGTMVVCFAAFFANPLAARADEAQGTEQAAQAQAEETENGPAAGETAASVVTVEAEGVSLYSEKSEESAIVGQASRGDTYNVVESDGDWVKVCSEEGTEGYLIADGTAAVIEEAGEAAEEEAEGGDIRQEVVDYALTFLGNPYVYGGSDPNTGTDCSGFTSYVLENAGGVDMNRSSRSQATQGTQVSAEQMQPGDLVFYASGSRINHVGLYIGDGQIVHASTERTGIKVSPWTYRNPVKIVSVLG